jgi:hypothetical protein
MYSNSDLRVYIYIYNADLLNCQTNDITGIAGGYRIVNIELYFPCSYRVCIYERGKKKIFFPNSGTNKKNT